MVSKAIIFYTNNELEPGLFNKVITTLKAAAEDVPIISVSQKPLDLGRNICVGPLPDEPASIYKQMLIGLCVTSAKVVFLAEHDCLYTAQHFKQVPENRNIFYYNRNFWYANWGRDRGEDLGLYFQEVSDGYRPAMSQLMCYRDILMENICVRIRLLENGWIMRRGIGGVYEPGVRERWCMRRPGEDDRVNPEGYFGARKYVMAWSQSSLPNIDVRHGENFTGRRSPYHTRKGKEATVRAWELPYWGKFVEVMNA